MFKLVSANKIGVKTLINEYKSQNKAKKAAEKLIMKGIFGEPEVNSLHIVETYGSNLEVIKVNFFRPN
jgi:predicted RNA-binding protein